MPEISKSIFKNTRKIYFDKIPFNSDFLIKELLIDQNCNWTPWKQNSKNSVRLIEILNLHLQAKFPIFYSNALKQLKLHLFLRLLTQMIAEIQFS